MLPSLKKHAFQDSIECIMSLILLIMENSSYPLLLLNSPMIINTPTLRMNKFSLEARWYIENQPNINLIYLQNSTSAFEFLNNYFDSRLFDPEKKFIFHGNITTDITFFVQKFYLNDVIFVDPFRGGIFTYYPIRYKNIRKIDERLVQIGTCNGPIKISQIKTADHYDFKGWTLHVWNTYCRKNYVGLDILKIILETWRVTYKIFCKKSHTRFKVLMLNHEFDIMFTNYRASNAVAIGKSLPYYFDTISVFTIEKPSQALENYLSLTFTTLVWCGIIAIISLISVSLISVRASLHNQHVAKNIWNIFLFNSCNVLYVSEIMLIIFLSLFRYFMGTFYVGAFFQIQTTDKMNNSTVFVENFSNRKIAYPADVPGSYLIQSKNRITCKNQKECLEYAIIQEKMGVALFERMTGRMRQSFQNETIKFVKMKPHIIEATLIFLIVRGHPLIHSLNYYLRLLRENGLLQRIESKYDPIQTKNSRTIHKLSFRRIQAAFIFLVCGMIMGLVLFFMEFIGNIHFRLRYVPYNYV